MIEGAKPTSQAYVPAFFVLIDGKEYGPFASQHEEEMRSSYRHRGISSRYATVKPSELVDVPCKKPAKKAYHPDLF